MVLDQAGWHDSRALSVPANVTLVPLPSYSPELNPVERVWLHLKERFLSHRLHDDCEAIVAHRRGRLASNRSAPTRGSRRSRLRIDGMT
jgi:transposase